MLIARLSHRRGGAMALTLIGVGVISLGTAAAVSFRSTGVPTVPAAKASRLLQPGEVATAFHLIGIHPEGVAAAGVSGLQCDALFDTGTVYGLQAERLSQLQVAHRNLNLANDKAVHPGATAPTDGGGHALSTAQCQSALTDLENAGFQFVTSGLTAGQIQKLGRIKANQHWGLPEAYMTVDRADEQWLTLRGALAAKKYSQQHGLDLAPGLAQIISTADADTTVAQALLDSTANLNGVRQSWQTHER